MENQENRFSKTSSEATKSLVSRAVSGNKKKHKICCQGLWRCDWAHTEFVRSGFKGRVIKWINHFLDSRPAVHFSDNLSTSDIISSDIPAAGGGFKEYMDITMLYIVTFKLKFGTYDIHVHNCWCSSSPGFLIEEIKWARWAIWELLFEY